MALSDWLRLLTVLAARIGLGMVAGLLIWSHVPALSLGWKATAVLGESMRPRLTPGDVVVYQPLHGRRPDPGQVVVVRDPAHPSRLLVHRAAKILRDGDIVTAGDNNPAVDSTPVPPSSVLGLARLRIPGLALPVVSWREGDRGLAALTFVALAVTARVAALAPIRRGRGSVVAVPPGAPVPAAAER
ncbi:signal peptidase I [Streptomyces sp. HUAS ZL42]|uniref:signal peptidase I n=1 Tax=Streptomyces sp. HUAS ZL42 TaxID=3231715 RepID=UPI00345EC0FB